MPNNSSLTRIKKLSPLLINQLAAGEVVTRPAAVVKELLENAIDAGATHIEVRVTQGGMGMIEVVDNGTGIHPDDMVMAVTRHATSKVADIASLQGINTLGFRGEALSAMVAVSRLTLISSHDDSGIGRQLQVAGILADTPKLTPIVHNRGTTVTLKDLYFNVPARRGNLKSIGTEFAHIETIVREVALARADVALSLFHDHKKRLSLSSPSVESNHSRLPLSRLEQALGIALTADAIPITVDLSSLLHSNTESLDTASVISGWLWTSHTSQAALPKLLYVNGRLIKEAIISQQLWQLATNMQLDGIGYALYFELPSDWLNVNVHPTKQRIKISPLNNIMAHLAHAVRMKLKRLLHQIVPIADVNSNLGIKVEDVRVSSRAHTSSQPVQQDQSIQKEVAYNSGAVDYLAKTEPSQQQVAAPYTPYQRLAGKGLTASKVDANRQMHTILPVMDSEILLPYCLQVVDRLDNKISSPIENDHSTQRLLFHSNGQCLLITETAWHGIWQMVMSEELRDTNQPDSLYLIEHPLSLPDKKIMNVQLINQQINSYASQLSARDLLEFATFLEQRLEVQALSMLNTEKLIRVMLSSIVQ